MTINDVYVWLLNTDPISANQEIRDVWTNMASYCYFVNTLDFDRIYQRRLKQILNKSVQYNISLPTPDHSKVIEISEHLKMAKIDSYIQSRIHDTRHHAIPA